MSTIKQPTRINTCKQLIIDHLELLISIYGPDLSDLNNQDKEDIEVLSNCLQILNHDKIDKIVGKLMLEAGIADDVNLDLICGITGFRLN